MPFDTIIEAIGKSPFITVIMLAIGLCSVVVLAVLLERLWSLRRGRIVPRRLVNKVIGLVKSKSVNDAVAVCDKSNAPVAGVVSAGLKCFGHGRSEVEHAILAAGARVSDAIRRHLELLDTIATAAPLLGLLGTVVGMIQAFAVIAEKGVGDPEKLAGGISNALITTAAGLTVAIPALVVYHWAKKRGDRVIRDVESSLDDIFGTHLSEGVITAEETSEASK